MSACSSSKDAQIQSLEAVIAELKNQGTASETDKSTNVETKIDIPVDAEAEYIKSELTIVSYKIVNDETTGNETGLQNFEIKNNGDKTITELGVTVYFYDNSGAANGESTVYIISSYDPPLKPGYSFRSEDYIYYQLQNLGSDIEPSRNSIEITSITFE